MYLIYVVFIMGSFINMELWGGEKGEKIKKKVAFFSTPEEAKEKKPTSNINEERETKEVEKSPIEAPKKLSEPQTSGSHVMHHNAFHGDKKKLEDLLRLFEQDPQFYTAYSPNVCDNQENTPLHMAAKNDQAEVIALLLKHGANIDAHNDGGKTPLHIAIEFNALDAATLLIKQGAHLSIKKRDTGDTPLHYLLAKGKKLDSLFPLIRQSKIKQFNCFVTNEEKETILHCYRALTEPLALACLLKICRDQEEIEPNKCSICFSKNRTGQTPYQKIMFLYNHTDKRSSISESITMCGEMLRNFENERRRKYLNSIGDQHHEAFFAIHQDNVFAFVVWYQQDEEARLLKTITDKWGKGLFPAAARFNSKEMLNYFCERLQERERSLKEVEWLGLYTRDNKDSTALHFAVEENNCPLVEWLLTWKAFHPQDNCPFSPLDRRSTGRDGRGDGSENAIDIAAEKGHYAVLNCLLKELDPSSLYSVPNDFNYPPAHPAIERAAINGHLCSLYLLLKKAKKYTQSKELLINKKEAMPEDRENIFASYCHSLSYLAEKNKKIFLILVEGKNYLPVLLLEEERAKKGKTFAEVVELTYKNLEVFHDWMESIGFLGNRPEGGIGESHMKNSATLITEKIKKESFRRLFPIIFLWAKSGKETWCSEEEIKLIKRIYHKAVLHNGKNSTPRRYAGSALSEIRHTLLG